MHLSSLVARNAVGVAATDCREEVKTAWGYKNAREISLYTRSQL
jgi:hypothetical protein